MDSTMLILDLLFGYTFCVYIMRKSYISDLCGFFIKAKVPSPATSGGVDK